MQFIDGMRAAARLAEYDGQSAIEHRVGLLSSSTRREAGIVTQCASRRNEHSSAGVAQNA